MSNRPRIKDQSFDGRSGLLSRIAAHPSNYWIGFASDPATALFLLFWDWSVLAGNPFALAAAYLLGLSGWTLFEYCFHRWIYHRGETLAHAGHRLHHDSPRLLIGMPWFLTTAFLLSIWYVFGWLLRVNYVLSIWAGLATGFLIYGLFHHIHHHFNVRARWYRKLKAHHQIHHQMPDVNFGVTNRFWDYIFNTTHRKSGGKSTKRRSMTGARLKLRSSTAVESD